jgi:hypothetical protein
MSDSRVEIAQLKITDSMTIYVESDSTKTYASIHIGMVGEGILEVGYSAVNGSASFNEFASDPQLKGMLYEEAVGTAFALDLASNNSVRGVTEWLVILQTIAANVNDEYNKWLGEVSSGEREMPSCWSNEP